ncbi:MAG TPA: Rrf2 family transcriptional regulator [Peptococcaceae bacterium]|nr:MAG: DNA-binding transcriptional regulator [Clostridia bacterium 41_269]HBT20232.1 Rrf2 family transcriptional regulator [Peptococcaceae bacterium]
MFRISTKGSYGLRAVLDIAKNSRGKPVPLKDIAERQEISEGYLEQLLTVLRRAGIVKSIRGQSGGFILAKKPQDISVGEIIRVLEGPIAPMDCVEDGTYPSCDNINQCVLRLVWLRLKERIEEAVDTITIEDLCSEAGQKQQGKKDQ